MKIILSRKGFDSASGGQPSPIMPDGTLLSLPIPSGDDDNVNTYSSLYWNEISYYEIIHSLKPKTKIKPDDFCHLDPDLRKDVCNRKPGWKPAFGQIDSALTHLRNNHVSEGDLFLFFGWFRKTEVKEGQLVYVKESPDQHIIYGYMQIGEIIENKDNVPHWLEKHPHYDYNNLWCKNSNAIFLPSEVLSFDSEKKGCDILNFRQDRVLTKDGMSRGCWDLPQFFKEVQITYHPHPWKDGYFKSAGRGQEFVLDATPAIIDWTTKILT
jgi:hypothetical protein